MSRHSRLAVIGLLLCAALATALWPAREPVSRLLTGARPGVFLGDRPVGGLYRSEVEAVLLRLAKATDTAPVNANLDPATAAVIPERPGRALEVQPTLRQVMSALPLQRVEPIYRVLPARWTAADLRDLTRQLSRYVTYAYGPGERWFNIRRALQSINNRVVFPGEVFSFIGHMPPFDAGGGWRHANVILDGAMTPAPGGGVCQVSSTLYAAVRRARLQVVERHPHGLKVEYIPAGMDATVAARPLLDFRFRNNTDSPLRISAALRGGAVTVVLLTLPDTPRPALTPGPGGAAGSVVAGPVGWPC